MRANRTGLAPLVAYAEIDKAKEAGGMTRKGNGARFGMKTFGQARSKESRRVLFLTAVCKIKPWKYALSAFMHGRV